MVLDAPAASTPLGRGIKHIGIGKYGSKPLTPELLTECRAALIDPTAHPLQRGAFLGALLAKGPTAEERTLEDVIGKGAFSHPTFFINKLCPDLPEGLLPIATKLVRGANLQVSEAEQLGDYLFSDGRCETFRGLAASIMRVRHETNEEYQGLMRAAERTFTPGFGSMSCADRPLVQLAEPFDGVENSYLITPLLAQLVQKRGYGAISLVGRSGGPKFTLNALDLYMNLGCQFLQSNHELDTPLASYGWVLDQKALSPALNRWVDRRHVIIKRPFLATLEKVLNPCHAQILVTSVFHITYQMKMAELAMLAGFDGVIVLKRGLEGSLAPSTSRACGVLCAVRTPRGHLFFQHFEGDSGAFSTFRTETETEYEQPQALDNARLVRQFMVEGKTANADFDNRVRFAHALYGRGLDWIEGQLR
ncbi:anthranilate phosphoribosyltransferase [Spirosoma sp. KCTC 42546]|uniref:anthranilate phosphoribosyltransferase n=1 Tax=Spirosoma sp. KCTC 42546 TaxID=2520506 RepID=UPI001159267D|nr:anthranilate phosphoribosyltransferase [Spirosoma sp. KCTC 42546]QDK83358.1 anthranilate phosphoribosyltransferase [Spirosoma sp. KCTC 42546]